MEPQRTVIYFIIFVFVYSILRPDHKPVAVAPENPTIAYTVFSGDTLEKVASVFDVSKEEIRRWNGLSTDILQRGQQIVISSPVFARPSRGVVHSVRQGETLYGLAKLYNLSVIDVVQANRLQSETVTAGQQLFMPQPYKNREDLRKNFTGDDWLLLAKIICAEAKGEPEKGQIAVGGVVINRMLGANFPNTFKGVIYQPGQFTPAASGLNIKPDLDAFSAAKKALMGEDPSLGALFFSNLALAQAGTREMFARLKITTVIGRHTFAR